MAEQERFTEFVHPLIAVSIPGCFLFTQVEFLSRWIPSWPLPPLAALILVTFIGIITVLMGNLSHKERLSFSARLRELLVLALLLYLGASLVALFIRGQGGFQEGGGGGLQTRRLLDAFKPAFFNLTVTGLGLLQWVFSLILQGALRDRELLLAELEGTLTGAGTQTGFQAETGSRALELQYRLRDMGSLAEDTLKGIQKIRNITRILLAIILVEAVVHGLLFPGEGLAEHLFMLPLFLVYPFLSGLLSRYVREQYDAGAGIAPDRDSRSHQVRSLLWVILFVFFVAFLGAGSSSILPIQWILAFFSWLSSLLPRPDPLVPPTPEPLPQLPDMEQFRQDLEALGSNRNEPPDLTMLWLTLAVFSAVVAGFFIFYFLFSPLKSRYFWQRVRRILSPRSLWLGLRKFLSYLRPRKIEQIDGLDLDPDNLKQVREQLVRLTAEKQDRRKRTQLGKMVERYLRFLRWGESKKIPCKPSMAPGEYGELLARTFPELSPPIHEIAIIFEEALYGDSLITRDQWNRFVAAVEEVVQYEGNRI